MTLLDSSLLIRGCGFGLIGLNEAMIFSCACFGIRKEAAWLLSIGGSRFLLGLVRHLRLVLSSGVCACRFFCGVAALLVDGPGSPVPAGGDGISGGGVLVVVV